MKKFFFTSVLFLSISLFAHMPANAEEMFSPIENETMANAPTIKHCVNKEVPLTGYLPPSIWAEKGNYRGYIYLEYFEKTRNNTFLGTYCGILKYGNFAPTKESGDTQL